MNDIQTALFQAADQARRHSYAPYSRYPVGAAILSETGQIYAGTNIEESAYICTHAEQAAISNMITHEGAHRIVAVLVITGADGDGQLGTPCGHCRQWLREHGDPDSMQIHVAGPEGVRRTFTLAELLPYSFGPDNLRTPHR
jgi:cytidine deaminase